MELEEDEKVDFSQLSKEKVEKNIEIIEKQMMAAAKQLDFERAAELRDVLFELKAEADK
jgi:excinuclease ABC subunit B